LIEEESQEEDRKPAPPILILKPDAQTTGDYSKLEIRWKTRPISLEKGAAEYRVTILTYMDEELASQEISHSAKKEEKCRFTNDDFATLNEDTLITAKIAISVIGNEDIEEQYSEEFNIRFGEPPEQEKGGAGKKVRTFSEGLIELDDRDTITLLASAKAPLPEDAKGFVLLRTAQKRKSFRVFRPSLIREMEKRWVDENGSIGRWIAKVRSSGARAGAVEFVPFTKPESLANALWERTVTASRRMAEQFGGNGGGVGQIFDEQAKSFDTVVKEYPLAWAALLEAEECRPPLALVNTVEVQSLSGDTRGLIVLPSHPIRVAWQFVSERDK